MSVCHYNLKWPPVSASRLRHYGGGTVVHHYLDHRTGQHKRQTLSQEEMIGRYISHVPARHLVNCGLHDGAKSTLKKSFGLYIPAEREAIEGVKHSHRGLKMRTVHLVPLSRQALAVL